MKPHLARIRIFPIKSLDPYEVDRAQLLQGAGLVGDREYALFDADGGLLNAKRLGEALVSVRASYTGNGGCVELRSGAACDVFCLEEDQGRIQEWFGQQLGQAVSFRRDSRGGFPDDEEASGPTLISTASLNAVSRWFGLETEECRRRFRANLEIEGLDPFEEDTLYGPPGRPRRFRIGDVELLGTNPCARCAVPSLDSRTGSLPDPAFARRFSTWRERSRWPDSEIAGYGHFYRLAVNTRVASSHGVRTLRVGDSLNLVNSDP